MKLRSLVGRAALASVLGITGAQAGSKQAMPVSIDTTDRTAAGAVGTARNSLDAMQYIGCQLTGSPGTADLGYCTARTAAGVTGACTTTADTFKRVIAAIDSSSYVEFGWDASGTCNWLRAYNVSWAEPKK